MRCRLRNSGCNRRWPPFLIQNLAPPSFRLILVSVRAVGAHLERKGVQGNALRIRHGVSRIEMRGTLATIAETTSLEVVAQANWRAPPVASGKGGLALTVECQDFSSISLPTSSPVHVGRWVGNNSIGDRCWGWCWGWRRCGGRGRSAPGRGRDWSCRVRVREASLEESWSC
jgi:hypothetical protein